MAEMPRGHRSWFATLFWAREQKNRSGFLLVYYYSTTRSAERQVMDKSGSSPGFFDLSCSESLPIPGFLFCGRTKQLTELLDS